MSETQFVPFTLSMGAGLAIGVFYFGGLWLTILRVMQSPYAALWALTSFVARSAIAVGGFYFVAGGSWARLGVCLLGFLAARTLLIHYYRPNKRPQGFGRVFGKSYDS